MAGVDEKLNASKSIFVLCAIVLLTSTGNNLPRVLRGRGLKGLSDLNTSLSMVSFSTLDLSLFG